MDEQRKLLDSLLGKNRSTVSSDPHFNVMPLSSRTGAATGESMVGSNVLNGNRYDDKYGSGHSRSGNSSGGFSRHHNSYSSTSSGVRDEDSMHFSAREVDKFALQGCSPYELLRNTRSDIRQNPFTVQPTEKMINEWNSLPQDEKDKYGYEFDLLEMLQKLVRDCDRKVERNRKRAIDMEKTKRMNQAKELKSQISGLEMKIKDATEKANRLGDAGQIEMCAEVMGQVEEIELTKKEVEQKISDLEKDAPEEELVPLTWETRDPNKEFVCNITASLIASNEGDERIHSLLEGKGYKAWKIIREKLAGLKIKLNGRQRPKGSRDDHESYRNGSRDRSRDRSRDKRRDKKSSSRRTRSRSKDRRRRNRSRSRDRRR